MSPGCSVTYEILSYPLCRLYYVPGDKFEFQPNTYEYRPGVLPNFLSYLAVVLNGTLKEYITVNAFYKSHDGKQYINID